MLPQLILFKTMRGGSCGERNLKYRIALFDSGEWGELMVLSEKTSKSGNTRAPDPNDVLSIKLKRVLHYAELGELSHAARELESVGLALGCLSTLAELQDAQLRPSGPAEPINTAPSEGTPLISLERHLFGTVLRIARRGVSAGLSGNRNEFLRVCLDDDISFDALYDVGVIFARGQIPSEIAQCMKLARLTTLLKPNGRIRGIFSGDTF